MAKPQRKIARALMGEHKHTKQEADYGPGNSSEHCAMCEHFEEPNACEIVEGKIDPAGWCRYFQTEDLVL